VDDALPRASDTRARREILNTLNRNPLSAIAGGGTSLAE
jgi:hypothetical protein